MYIALFAANACDLLAPEHRETYKLTRVNGQPLPFVFVHRRDPSSGSVFELIQTNGQLTLFNGGRFLYEYKKFFLENGQRRASQPPDGHLVGAVSYGDSLVALSFVFRGSFRDGGRVLALQDIFDPDNRGFYEFERQ